MAGERQREGRNGENRRGKGEAGDERERGVKNREGREEGKQCLPHYCCTCAFGAGGPPVPSCSGQGVT